MRRVMARVAVAVGCLIILALAVAGALLQHRRSETSHPGDAQTELYRQGQHLRDIHTILLGTTLPSNQATCIKYVRIGSTEFGQHYPRVGSDDWKYLIAVCDGTADPEGN